MNHLSFSDAFPSKASNLSIGDSWDAYSVPMISNSNIPPSLAISTGNGYNSITGFPAMKHPAIGTIRTNVSEQEFTCFNTRTVDRVRSNFGDVNVEFSAQVDGLRDNVALNSMFSEWTSFDSHRTLCLISIVIISKIEEIAPESLASLPTLSSMNEVSSYGDQFVWRTLKGGRIELYVEIKSENASTRKKLANDLAATYKGVSVDVRSNDILQQAMTECEMSITASVSGRMPVLVPDVSKLGELIEGFRKSVVENPVTVSFFTKNYNVQPELARRFDKMRSLSRTASDLQIAAIEFDQLCSAFQGLGEQIHNINLLTQARRCQTVIRNAAKRLGSIVDQVRSHGGVLLEGSVIDKVEKDLAEIGATKVPLNEKESCVFEDLDVLPDVRNVFGFWVFGKRFPGADIVSGGFQHHMSHAGQFPYRCYYQTLSKLAPKDESGIQISISDGTMKGDCQYFNATTHANFSGEWTLDLNKGDGFLVIPNAAFTTRQISSTSGFQDPIPIDGLFPVLTFKLIGQDSLTLVVSVASFNYYVVCAS